MNFGDFVIVCDFIFSKRKLKQSRLNMSVHADTDNMAILIFYLIVNNLYNSSKREHLRTGITLDRVI